MSLKLAEFDRQEILIPDEYSLQSDIEKYSEEIISCIYESVKGTIDAVLYFEYLKKETIGELFGLTDANNHFYEEKSSFLLFHNQNLIGVNLVSMDGENSYVSQLAVHPQYRRHQLGKSLMINSILALKKMNVKELLLHVTSNNPAYLLYKGLGFVKKESRWVILKQY